MKLLGEAVSFDESKEEAMWKKATQVMGNPD